LTHSRVTTTDGSTDSLRLRRSTCPGQAAGRETPRPGRTERVLRHLLVEIRGLAGGYLQQGPLRRAGEVLSEEVRVRMLAGVCRNLPRGWRRLQLLPVPLPLLLEEALRRDAANPQVRSQGSRRSHRAEVARPRQVRHACGHREPGLP